MQETHLKMADSIARLKRLQTRKASLRSLVERLVAIISGISIGYAAIEFVFTTVIGAWVSKSATSEDMFSSMVSHLSVTLSVLRLEGFAYEALLTHFLRLRPVVSAGLGGSATHFSMRDFPLAMIN
jgi:hypothetical protein